MRCRRLPLLIAAAITMLAGATVLPHTAAFADVRDISFPQCGMQLPGPQTASAGVLGANGGRLFTANPCLVDQLRWAKGLAGAPAFYANTGNPGPDRSSRWPVGQSWPRSCFASDPNSIACSYDYGWNGAMDSYGIAVDAAQTLHKVSRDNARARVANVDWWLDVEILNSWQTLDGDATVLNGRRDTAAILGAVDALRSVGVRQVGIYSTSYQWVAITGAPKITRGLFTQNPVWLAGFDNQADAADGCGFRSFTGGQVLLTQYLDADGIDANVRCW
jgi:hypothetical protein